MPEQKQTPEQIAEERIEEARRTGATELDLSGLHLTVLPESLGQLTRLEKLLLSINQLTALPESLGRLSQLQTLSIEHNQFAALPEWLGKLSQLQVLYLNNNQLTALPESLGRLTQLQEFAIENNQLTALPEWLRQLTQLQDLFLHNNQLTALPEWLGQLRQLRQLYLHDNDALGIPAEVLGPTWDEVLSKKAQPANPVDILNYYFRLQHETRRRLGEAKVLIVGQGSVGKTSLVKRLVQNKYNPQELKTEGIEITRWQVAAERDGGELRVNVWDFGGQEIMHATHQFFLTRRSLYLLVIDARKGEDESRLNYWLKMIESFGKDSPVLVVINKIDAHPLELNEPRLRKDYPTIRGFFPVSCETGDGIKKLQAAIAEQINALPHVYDAVPASYFAVKQELEDLARQKDFLDIGEYLALCQQHAVAQPADQTQLLRFLHDLGNVLNFDDPDSPYRLPDTDTNILNPEWVTDGVYKIINDKALAHAGGVLDCQQLSGILTDRKRYPKRRHNFIVGMMRNFELCFEFPDSDGQKLLIPELLSPKEIDFNWPDSGTLDFQYHYDVLPPGLICRFIVKMHHHLNFAKNAYWRYGVMLTIQGNRAFVRADPHANKIFISIDGPSAGRRRALAVIRDKFQEIHHTIPGIKAIEQVPLPDAPNVVVSYEHLLKLEEKGITHFLPVGADKEYRARDLLDGIEERGFDVFLSHNSNDKPAVRDLSQRLQARGLRTWLDEDELPPGRPWQEELEKIIKTAKSAAVLVGKDGLGPWEIPEMRACLNRAVTQGIPVIPVLLPGAARQPDLPIFLEAFTWVDLRDGFSEAGLDRLEFGITGQKPRR